MADIFLSYSSQDRERVRPLVDAFARQGWTVWWGYRILTGASWDDAIEEALSTAKCVVVWSRAAVSSEWVRIEASIGRDKNILVPVLLDDVPLPLTFRHIQTASLRDWDGSDSAPGLLALESGIRAFLSERPSQPDLPPYVTEERALDAAMKRDLPVRVPANLIAMVRRSASGGLRAILETDDEYDLAPENVESKSLDLTFTSDKHGNALPAELIIRVVCPGFDPPSQEKKIRVFPQRDSSICCFLITPLESGQLILQVELYQEAECIGSRILRAEGILAADPVPVSGQYVISLPLLISVKVEDLAPAIRAAAVGGPAYSPAPSRARRPVTRSLPMERKRADGMPPPAVALICGTKTQYPPA